MVHQRSNLAAHNGDTTPRRVPDEMAIITAEQTGTFAMQGCIVNYLHMEIVLYLLSQNVRKFLYFHTCLITVSYAVSLPPTMQICPALSDLQSDLPVSVPPLTAPPQSTRLN